MFYILSKWDIEQIDLPVNDSCFCVRTSSLSSSSTWQLLTIYYYCYKHTYFQQTHSWIFFLPCLLNDWIVCYGNFFLYFLWNTKQKQCVNKFWIKKNKYFKFRYQFKKIFFTRYQYFICLQKIKNNKKRRLKTRAFIFFFFIFLRNFMSVLYSGI